MVQTTFRSRIQSLVAVNLHRVQRWGNLIYDSTTVQHITVDSNAFELSSSTNGLSAGR